MTTYYILNYLSSINIILKEDSSSDPKFRWDKLRLKQLILDNYEKKLYILEANYINYV